MKKILTGLLITLMAVPVIASLPDSIETSQELQDYVAAYPGTFEEMGQDLEYACNHYTGIHEWEGVTFKKYSFEEGYQCGAYTPITTKYICQNTDEEIDVMSYSEWRAENPDAHYFAYWREYKKPLYVECGRIVRSSSRTFVVLFSVREEALKTHVNTRHTEGYEFPLPSE